MKRTYKEKLTKFFKLLISTLKVQSSFYLSLLLLVAVIILPLFKQHDLFINLLASLIVTILVLALDIRIKYRKFSKLEGIYNAYLYESEGSADLADTSNAIFSVNYEGGNTISIEVVESLRGEKYKDYKWRGKAEITEGDIGTLYWYYFSPKKWRYFSGYKKIVIVEDKKETKIFLFSADRHVNIPDREVLIKQK